MLNNKIRALLEHKAGKTLIALALMAIALWMSGVEMIAGRILTFPLTSMAVILLFMYANLWVVAFRFWRVLLDFSYRVPFSIASRATFLGYFAGLMLISLFGQVVGRQAVLRQSGISPAVNSALSAYERSLLLIVSSLLGMMGATYLFGQQLVREFFNSISFFEIVAIITFSLAISLNMGGEGFRTRIASQILTLQNLCRVMMICVLTAAGQLLILASFVVGILALRPEAHLVSVFAAAALISFISSMPISVNGWGVREIASIFVLGKLGIPPEEAITVSILIGVASTLVIITGGLFVFKNSPHYPANVVEDGSMFKQSQFRDIEKVAAWSLSMSVMLTVFFQIHVSFDTGLLNFNLADPFAILALTAVALHCLTQQRLPQWRLSEFNRILIALSALLAIGFVIGASRFGVTQWALVSRLFGWLVLLGYLCAGYLLVAATGGKSLRRLVVTLSISAATIVAWQSAKRMLAFWGYEVGNLSPNFEGYAANRNAFAFQLLTVMALLLAYARTFTCASWRWPSLKWHILLTVMPATLAVGIAWTGSRAGLLTGFLLLAVAFAIKLLQLGQLIRIILLASLMWVAFWMAPNLSALFFPLNGIEHLTVQSVFSADSSNEERWATWVYAIKLWLDSPIWGAGLGAFMANSTEWVGHFQVIHSTPLWILAEFGIMGAVVSVFSVYKIMTYAGAAMLRPVAPHRSALLFVLLIFAVFSLVHEIFYQRIMWLALGALLAFPAAHGKAEAAHGQ
jgi:hypothetical protein